MKEREMKNNIHPIFNEILKPHQPKMKYTAKESIIYDENGNAIASVFITPRHKELINDEGWEKEKESWLEYRQRTKTERESEEQKRLNLAHKIAESLNKYKSL